MDEINLRLERLEKQMSLLIKTDCSHEWESEISHNQGYLYTRKCSKCYLIQERFEDGYWGRQKLFTEWKDLKNND